MPSNNSDAQGNNYFNDLSRQPSHRSSRSDSPPDPAGTREGSWIPRPKRIACIICRKRKLKCDGSKPSCGTCKRLGHECAYDEVRRKSGPKRGYVKELEARLAQVETQLKSKDRGKSAAVSRTASFVIPGEPSLPQPKFQLNNLDMGDHNIMTEILGLGMEPSAHLSVPNLAPKGNLDLSSDGFCSQEMIRLGLAEPLPPPDMIEKLHQIYFEKIHPSTPMMHKYRYLAAMNLAPHMRPPVCLRYAMWALACTVTEKYLGYREVFYQRARRYAEADEMKGYGESTITVGHAQCWSLISTYELKMLYFPRAWMSAGRSIRLVQMLGLHRLDGLALEVRQALPPPKDWTDREERRRTFWVAFCGDRYSSIGTGWPMAIDERDIMTNLPATDDAFEQSKPQLTLSLSEAMTSEGAASLSSHAGVVLMACLFGRNLTHLHRPDPNDRPEDTSNGEFWKRHRAMDTILTNTSLFLPEQLRLPAGVRDASIVFLNMNIHTSTICLHQAAILKAERHSSDPNLVRQSTDRCFLAAGEIVGIMRLTSHVNIGNMHPFISFCLYVAGRVYVRAYEKQSNDQVTYTNLEFLLNAMQAIRKRNPLTESFLVQLMVDLEGTGFDNPLNNSRFSFKLKKGASERIRERGSCVALLPSEDEVKCQYHLPAHVDVSPPTAQLHENSLGTGVGLSTQYGMSTFSLPNREQPSPQHRYNRFDGAPTQMQGVMLDQGWGENYSTAPNIDNSNSSHVNQAIDTDMSSEQMSERQNSFLSDHQTPLNSQQPSSNTSSYSPPTVDGSDLSSQPTITTNGHPIAFLGSPNQFPSFTPAPKTQFPHNPNSPDTQDSTGFILPTDWELGDDGAVHTHSGALTDFSPLGESSWTQILEGMGWDGNTLGAGGEIPWRAETDGSTV
ncbi:MAG: hypothetical protein Q9187_003294 [Circinaria calcarea]